MSELISNEIFASWKELNDKIEARVFDVIKFFYENAPYKSACKGLTWVHLRYDPENTMWKVDKDTIYIEWVDWDDTPYEEGWEVESNSFPLHYLFSNDYQQPYLPRINEAKEKARIKKEEEEKKRIERSERAKKAYAERKARLEQERKDEEYRIYLKVKLELEAENEQRGLY